jgi:hypothetical protein
MTLRFEKPRKEDRKRANFDTSDMPLAKFHPDRSGDYKAFIRTHRCLLHWYTPCEGPVEAAHMQRGGKSIKGSDYSCVPLCAMRHHKLLDGNSLDFEIVAWLWQKTWEFAVNWFRRTE